MNNHDKYYVNFIYDEPIMYKNLTLYPVLVRDYNKFYAYASCLMDAKNDFPLFISKSYLDYLYETNNDDNNNLAKLHLLLGLCLRLELVEGKNIFYGKNDKGKFVIQIADTIYNGQDIEELRDIIADQNGLELPNENIQKRIRDGIEEAKKMKAGNTKMAGLEDMIVAMTLMTPYKIEDIYGLTLRKYSKMVERADAKIHYEIFLQSSLSGMVEWKDRSMIKHWLSDLSRDELSEYLTPLEDLRNKVSGKA